MTVQLSSSQTSHTSNIKYILMYMESWTVMLFIGCKSSMAVRKRGKEFYAAAAERDCLTEARVRAKHTAASGLVFRNCRENRLEYSSVHLHCFFALPESTIFP